MKKIAVLGSGTVGEVLANGLLKYGYEVMRGTRESSKLAAWHAQAGAYASVGSFAEAAQFGEVVLLAVKGSVAEEVIGGCARRQDCDRCDKPDRRCGSGEWRAQVLHGSK